MIGSDVECHDVDGMLVAACADVAVDLLDDLDTYYIHSGHERVLYNFSLTFT